MNSETQSRAPVFESGPPSSAGGPLDRPFSRAGDDVCLHLAAVLVVFVAYWVGLDNFFAGDDFDWLFETRKMLALPAHVFDHMAHNYFLRPTESAWFVLNYLVAGYEPFAYQLSALAVHLINVVLVSVVLRQLSGSAAVGFAAALFWGLDYKQAEAVLRPYGVADSLALLFCLAAVVVGPRQRPWSAAMCFLLGALAKENAVIFPVVLLAHEVLVGGRRRWREVGYLSPLFAVSCAVGGLGAWIRSGGSSYLQLDPAVLPRFWELLLTYIGPDALWLRYQVHGDGAQLLSPWTAAAAVGVAAVVFCWLPARYQFAMSWIVLMTGPTVFVPNQTSRYYYIPLVGVSLIVGHVLVGGLARWEAVELRPLRLAALGVYGLVLVYHALGIRVEEDDYDHLGELHRQAATSFRRDVLPELRRSPNRMVVFITPGPEPMVDELLRWFDDKPWYTPTTQKTVFVRPGGVLGLTNTYGFVTYCAVVSGSSSGLFVRVPRSTFRERLMVGDYVAVVHDYQTNRFALAASRPDVSSLSQEQLDALYRSLQPGIFDPTSRGTLYLEK